MAEGNMSIFGGYGAKVNVNPVQTPGLSTAPVRTPFDSFEKLAQVTTTAFNTYNQIQAVKAQELTDDFGTKAKYDRYAIDKKLREANDVINNPEASEDEVSQAQDYVARGYHTDILESNTTLYEEVVGSDNSNKVKKQMLGALWNTHGSYASSLLEKSRSEINKSILQENNQKGLDRVFHDGLTFKQAYIETTANGAKLTGKEYTRGEVGSAFLSQTADYISGTPTLTIDSLRTYEAQLSELAQYGEDSKFNITGTDGYIKLRKSIMTAKAKLAKVTKAKASDLVKTITASHIENPAIIQGQTLPDIRVMDVDTYVDTAQFPQLTKAYIDSGENPIYTEAKVKEYAKKHYYRELAEAYKNTSGAHPRGELITDEQQRKIVIDDVKAETQQAFVNYDVNAIFGLYKNNPDAVTSQLSGVLNTQVQSLTSIDDLATLQTQVAQFGSYYESLGVVGQNSLGNTEKVMFKILETHPNAIGLDAVKRISDKELRNIPQVTFAGDEREAFFELVEDTPIGLRSELNEVTNMYALAFPNATGTEVVNHVKEHFKSRVIDNVYVDPAVTKQFGNSQAMMDVIKTKLGYDKGEFSEGDSISITRGFVRVLNYRDGNITEKFSMDIKRFNTLYRNRAISLDRSVRGTELTQEKNVEELVEEEKFRAKMYGYLDKFLHYNYRPGKGWIDTREER